MVDGLVDSSFTCEGIKSGVANCVEVPSNDEHATFHRYDFCEEVLAELDH